MSEQKPPVKEVVDQDKSNTSGAKKKAPAKKKEKEVVGVVKGCVSITHGKSIFTEGTEVKKDQLPDFDRLVSEGLIKLK